jgi:hypothetical protein
MLESAQVVGFVHIRRRVARGDEKNQDDQQHFG